IGSHVVAIWLLLFALSTAISWSYYGDRAMGYLFGKHSVKPYRFVYCFFHFLGAIWGIDLVWSFCDMVITFMTIPNLIAMILLSGVVFRETKAYLKEKKKGFVSP
ncbi:MAG: alanine:cation symporter family protein, partial [Elusimicrobiales bacterium]|nr:alanine:cation symporter family protein [Elusimicrobiales bacterium]